MKFCVHYYLQRPTDEQPVRHIINDVLGANEEEAERNARSFVEEQGFKYVSTVRVIDTFSKFF